MTKNIVPRLDGTGEIGTSAKKWNKVNAQEVSSSAFIGDGTLVTNVDADTVDGKHATDFDLDYVTDNGNATANSIEVTSLTASANVVASAFYGDGSGITGVTGDWDGQHSGSAAITGSLTVSGSGAIFEYVGPAVQLGNPAVNPTISIYGEFHSNLIPNSGQSIGNTSNRWGDLWAGDATLETLDVSGSSRFGNLLTDTHVFTGSFHQTGSGATSVFKDHINVEGQLSASSYVGDGSGITGVTGDWDGQHDGDAAITGSLTVSQLTASAIAAPGVNGELLYNLNGTIAEIDDGAVSWDPITGMLTLANGINYDNDGNVEAAGFYSITSGDEISLKADGTGAYVELSGTHSDKGVWVRSSMLCDTNITASGHVSASVFYGDGSQLEGVTGGWDGQHTGDAAITGTLSASFLVGDGTGITGLSASAFTNLGVINPNQTSFFHPARVDYLDTYSEHYTSYPYVESYLKIPTVDNDGAYAYMWKWEQAIASGPTDPTSDTTIINHLSASRTLEIVKVNLATQATSSLYKTYYSGAYGETPVTVGGGVLTSSYFTPNADDGGYGDLKYHSASYGEYLYFTPSLTSLEIYRLRADGASSAIELAVTSTLAPGSQFGYYRPMRLAIHDDNLYWSQWAISAGETNITASLMKAVIAPGGTLATSSLYLTTSLAGNPNFVIPYYSGLAADSTHIYWSGPYLGLGDDDNSGIMRASLTPNDTGSFEMLYRPMSHGDYDPTSVGLPGNLMVDSSQNKLYYVDQGGKTSTDILYNPSIRIADIETPNPATIIKLTDSFSASLTPPTCEYPVTPRVSFAIDSNSSMLYYCETDQSSSTCPDLGNATIFHEGSFHSIGTDLRTSLVGSSIYITASGGSIIMSGSNPTQIGDTEIDGTLLLGTETATPSQPQSGSSGTDGRIYVKGGNLIVQYNVTGSTYYKYLDLTGEGVNWNFSSSEP
tara:strand:+ start:1615 stop:4449 length:2835 start_codon:yes stop_codon:yes gene_type:complete